MREVPKDEEAGALPPANLQTSEPKISLPWDQDKSPVAEPARRTLGAKAAQRSSQKTKPPADIWEYLSLRVDIELSDHSFAERSAAKDLIGALRVASYASPYANSVGAAVETFLDFGGIQNQAGSDNRVQTLRGAFAADQRHGEALLRAAVSIEIALLDRLSSAPQGT